MVQKHTLYVLGAALLVFGCGGYSADSQAAKPAFSSEDPRTWEPLLLAPSTEPDAVWFSDLKVSDIDSWNTAARAAVSRHSVSPPQASRIYAALSVASFDGGLLSGKRGGSVRAGAIESSRLVMRTLFPQDSSFWDDLAEVQLGENPPGANVGAEAAQAVLDHLRSDSSQAADLLPVPIGDQFWVPHGPERAVLPGWGRVKRWVDGFTPSIAAPERGSIEEADAAQAVANATQGATHDEIALARKYALGKGTPTPPGLWNELILNEAKLSANDPWSGLRLARVLALANTAMMDAGIDCWQVKYEAMRLRPSQINAGVKLHIALPSHPSFPSGHSSFSASAAEVLNAAWPEQKSHWRRIVQEASMSRFLGGVHFQHDMIGGEILGQAAGRRVLAWARSSKN